MNKKEFKARQEFLNKYKEIDILLESLGFRVGHYFKESATVYDILYTEYRKYINPLYAVEHYVHDILDIQIRFIRDWNEHRIMFVVDIMTLSDSYSLEGAKELIIKMVKDIKDKKLNELNLINI
jgi:hypothetical protein